MKTPQMLQMEAVECGAAALGSILGYYGRFVSLEELRVRCGVTSHGAFASNVIQAANSYGLEAKAFRKKAETLLEETEPFIAFWKNAHFLVVESMSRGEVQLNDPAVGHRSVSFQEFTESYSGVAICFTVGSTFEKGGEEPSTWKSLYRKLKPFQSHFFYLFIVQLTLMVPTIAMAGFIRVFIDTIVINQNYGWIWFFIAFFGGNALINAALTALKGHGLMHLKLGFSIDLSHRFLVHLLRLPFRFFEQRTSGDLGFRLQMTDMLSEKVVGPVADAALNIMMIGVYGLVLLLSSVPLALIAIVEGLINLWLLWAVSKTRTSAIGSVVQSQLKLIGFSTSGLRNMDTLKSMGIERSFFAKWADLNTKWLSATQEFGRKTVGITVASPFVSSLGTAAIYVLGAYLIMKGEMSFGTLFGMNMLKNYFQQPLLSLIGLGKTIQEISADVARIDDTLSLPEIEEEAPLKEHFDIKGAIEAKDLRFTYHPTSPAIIRSVSFSAGVGKTIAFVGRSGCGKSTLGYILSGLYEQEGGELLIDGHNYHQLPLLQRSQSIAHVDQDIVLFSGSIRENITLWDPTITDSSVVEAAKDACIHDRIMQRKGGYDSILASDGQDLSGGERQRLEIARALVHSPSILILDEATSALDSITEEKILRNIKRRGSTCIYIAHRLHTIRDVDEICVLQKGSIVERGTFEELMAVDGHFAALAALDDVGAMA